MACRVPDDVWPFYSFYIQEKREKGWITEEEGGCLVWQGSRRGGSKRQRIVGGCPYGQMRVSWGEGSALVYVHQLAYAVHVGFVPGPPLQVSHLCHNCLCVNVAHLVAEEGSYNRGRMVCREAGYCIGHQPPCLL